MVVYMENFDDVTCVTGRRGRTECGVVSALRTDGDMKRLLIGVYGVAGNGSEAIDRLPFVRYTSMWCCGL